MNKISLRAIGFCFSVIAFIVTDASAYYHPAMGRFMQRDPGPGASMRLGTAGPAVVAGFVSREPLSQYADGMNLYQYVQSNPVGFHDASGLLMMGGGDSPSREDIVDDYINEIKHQRLKCTRLISIDGHGSDDGSVFIGDGSDLYPLRLTDMPAPRKCCSTIRIVFKTCYAGRNKSFMNRMALLYKNKCPNSKVIVEGCNNVYRQFLWSTGPGYCTGDWVKVIK